ncbi:hypothetical protein B0H17DRAFT_1157687 [Mycena rosella]|uniref:NADH:flavin oxidoreductase/NADH oxidase N-terminal domain-containing protein n=1 Tax=Mycena rosella TaxID=1033263 RepID=A0AAD7DXA8_MYCRO|nr:hypothetical protein B0H17DRAFT_1157687 [Mycena rosella]
METLLLGVFPHSGSSSTGNIALQHRVVLAPLTRFKATMTEQRASTPGTLLITEATFIAARVGGYNHIQDIWSPAQIAAARSLVPHISASEVQRPGYKSALRPLTVPEITEYVGLYAQAAKNAIEAGFDGVEIHGPSQFISCAARFIYQILLQAVTNTRTDGYGGSIANCARFTLEVVDALVAAVSAEKTAIRLKPRSPLQGASLSFSRMAMEDLIPTFSHLIPELAVRHPTLAYLHLVEPRIEGGATREESSVGAHESNDTLRALWAPRPFIRAGGFSREGALVAAESGDLIAFGRLFIANKDLPLAPYNRTTFYISEE